MWKERLFQPDIIRITKGETVFHLLPPGYSTERDRKAKKVFAIKEGGKMPKLPATYKREPYEPTCGTPLGDAKEYLKLVGGCSDCDLDHSGWNAETKSYDREIICERHARALCWSVYDVYCQGGDWKSVGRLL